MRGLTKREHDIARLVGKGLPNEDIAAELGTSELTVKVQLRGIMRQYGFKNRVQLAVWTWLVGMTGPVGRDARGMETGR